MKAVILAGGEGSRLRPLTIGRPKPMAPLLGKPVLGHILDLLRRHGVTQVALTLRTLPAAITDHFGDGAEYGVKLTYFVEQEPLGTAGGVRQCLDFLGEEDFLVLSGDGVCDLDLGAFMALHQSRGSAASLALCRRSEPLEYGLVRTDDAGRVLGFVEKPGWGQVDTELVNTGIYLLSRRCMEQVPAGVEYDFGRDLFPALLQRGEALYGWEVPGYWQDMGDCGAYLAANLDALAGQVALDAGTGRTRAPAGVEVREPVWIGERTQLAPGCVVGPYAVIGEGSTLGTGAVVERSVVLGASVGEGAEVTGAILCPGAAVHRRAMVGAGAVLGDGAVVGAEAIVAPGVKLWPRCRVEEGERATASRLTAGAAGPLHFSHGGALRGTVGEQVSAETLLTLGALLGEGGQVAIGWAGGSAAGMLARAASCGVSTAGGESLFHDGACPAAGAWLGKYYGLPASLFVQVDDDLAELRIFGPDGLPLPRERQRKLEGALLRGETARVPAPRMGSAQTITGVGPGYAEETARAARLGGLPLRRLRVWVEPGEGANDALARALGALGCQVSRGTGRGEVTFRADWGGFRLLTWDETGRPISPDRLLVLLTRIEMEQGRRRLALPGWAPAAAEEVAASFGGGVLRLGRDGEEAMTLWREQPWFRDAASAGCRLCARLALTGESLAHLNDSVPKFHTVRREVPLHSGRGRVMGEVLSRDRGARSQGEGVRTAVGGGWVYLSPMSARNSLRLIVEAAELEAAEEICDFYDARLRQLDGE